MPWPRLGLTMNAMNSLFGALPMPGSGGAATPPPEAALPALVPTGGAFDDDSWADVEAPEVLGEVRPLCRDVYSRGRGWCCWRVG